MKKEYITPEVEVVDVLGCSIIANSLGEGDSNKEWDSRDDYDYNDNTPTRPGSGNVWDQGW